MALAMHQYVAPAFGNTPHESRAQTVAKSNGLVAFWDFNRTSEDRWISVHDPDLPLKTFPISLRKIGDPVSYSLTDWPYQTPEAAIQYDTSGPFGKAVRFSQGHIYGAVERAAFDKSLLDIRGRQPFTMIAWVKFTGKRHLVAGIWDEGGWNKYAGRRQIALFGGLFNQKGTIAHISATGAASYPQSTTSGSQYARLRAIDGQPFENNQWVAMAMSYDPEKNEVKAYLNGKITPLLMDDPVSKSVYPSKNKKSANPFNFPLPIYSPDAFALKFNGYSSQAGVYEHRLLVNLDKQTIAYQRDQREAKLPTSFRIRFDIKRDGTSILDKEQVIVGDSPRDISISANVYLKLEDEVIARLESMQNNKWKQVGTVVKRKLQLGAPFTFGRALGLGSEDPKHGSQLFIDGVAVYERVLPEQELKHLCFIEN